MSKLFGNRASEQGGDDEDCPSSGWTVRRTVTNRGNGSGEQCPSGDHDVSTTSSGWGVVRIDKHRR